MLTWILFASLYLKQQVTPINTEDYLQKRATTKYPCFSPCQCFT